MDTANKANMWRWGIQASLLMIAVAGGVIGVGRCKKPEQAPPAEVKSERHDVIRGVEGRMLVVHHHGSDIAADKKIDELLLAFAAEPGPRHWSWICLAPPDIGDGASFLSFHDGQVLLAEFRGPWEREAVRSAVEQTAAGYLRGRSERARQSTRRVELNRVTVIELVGPDSG